MALPIYSQKFNLLNYWLYFIYNIFIAIYVLNTLME